MPGGVRMFAIPEIASGSLLPRPRLAVACQAMEHQTPRHRRGPRTRVTRDRRVSPALSRRIRTTRHPSRSASYVVAGQPDPLSPRRREALDQVKKTLMPSGCGSTSAPRCCSTALSSGQGDRPRTYQPAGALSIQQRGAAEHRAGAREPERSRCRQELNPPSARRCVSSCSGTGRFREGSGSGTTGPRSTQGPPATPEAVSPRR